MSQIVTEISSSVENHTVEEDGFETGNSSFKEPFPNNIRSLSELIKKAKDFSSFVEEAPPVLSTEGFDPLNPYASLKRKRVVNEPNKESKDLSVLNFPTQQFSPAQQFSPIQQFSPTQTSKKLSKQMNNLPSKQAPSKQPVKQPSKYKN